MFARRHLQGYAVFRPVDRYFRAAFLPLAAAKGFGLIINCKIFNNIPWHSQKNVADFFGRSVTTIGAHLKEMENKNNHVVLISSNTEGDRLVTRNIKYYSFDCVASLCYRISDLRHAQLYRDFLRPLGIVFPEVIAIACDEKNYRSCLMELLIFSLNFLLENIVLMDSSNH